MSAAYFVALNRLEKLTPLRFQKLLDFFSEDVERIWQASRSDWQRAGVEFKAVSEIWPKKEKIEPAVELEKLEKLDVKVLPITSEKYPILLREIYAPPPVLLIRGEFPTPADKYAVGVVGSRVTTPYGRQATVELTRGLAQAGVTIISGLALGHDALAHKTAVEFSARTVAVLGCGIEQIYPPANRKLAEDILQKGGAIISEYPIGTEPTAYNFPQRNRIIAGLCRGVLIVEGKEKSGSLITAELALEFGREVFAVPGSIFADTSAGPNKLIKAGAKPISSAAEILESLNLENLPAKVRIRKIIADTPEEAKILQTLSREPLHIDEITRTSGLTASEAGALLSLLEMKGLVKNLGGMQWVRV